MENHRIKQCKFKIFFSFQYAVFYHADLVKIQKSQFTFDETKTQKEIKALLSA